MFSIINKSNVNLKNSWLYMNSDVCVDECVFGAQVSTGELEIKWFVTMGKKKMHIYIRSIIINYNLKVQYSQIMTNIVFAFSKMLLFNLQIIH